MRRALGLSASRAMRETVRSRRIVRALFAAAIALLAISMPLAARDREPNSVYADRRVRLIGEVKGPVVLVGYTGREKSSPSYVFRQRPNSYYLTGQHAGGATLLLVP